MNVSGVGSGSGMLGLDGLNALQSASGVAALNTASGTSQTAGVSGDLSSAVDSVEISRPAQMLSKLQQLKSKDPAQFKQVLTDIANKLRALSQQQGQSGTDSWLSKLADRFQTAANTGDLSALQPHGHHHHSHSAPGAYAQSGAQSAQDQQSTLSSTGASPSAASVKGSLSSIFSEIDTALAR